MIPQWDPFYSSLYFLHEHHYDWELESRDLDDDFEQVPQSIQYSNYIPESCSEHFQISLSNISLFFNLLKWSLSKSEPFLKGPSKRFKKKWFVSVTVFNKIFEIIKQMHNFSRIPVASHEWTSIHWSRILFTVNIFFYDSVLSKLQAAYNNLKRCWYKFWKTFV